MCVACQLLSNDISPPLGLSGELAENQWCGSWGLVAQKGGGEVSLTQDPAKMDPKSPVITLYHLFIGEGQSVKLVLKLKVRNLYRCCLVHLPPHSTIRENPGFSQFRSEFSSNLLKLNISMISNPNFCLFSSLLDCSLH